MKSYRHLFLWCCVAVCLGCATTSVYGDYEVVHTVKLADPVDLTDETPREYRLVQQFNQRGAVTGYKMELKTDVCLERICKMVDLTLYWDAKGRYVKLETPPNTPLTKNEHDPFTKADYRKLDRILKNNQSLLGSYPLSTFVESAAQKGSDAISGATKQRVMNEIVPGAAYSTWVLWRWVHGEVTHEITRLTDQAKS